ncbi:O-antigen ligase family protein [Cryobacterium sp. Sr8]|uniref:O-antigen ligase family protein n=1 Tax=Cryobacterium sp. Sr8 TaxID=1259203 RepID=UPI00141BC24A|nr:O-antigen ligase family protein [Cryobacterium sp. Sr8]
MLALRVLRAWTRPARAGVADLSLPERLWLSAGLALAATAVVLSASRAGLLAAGIALLVLLVLEIVRGARGPALRSLGIAAAGALVLLGGALAVPFTRDRLLGASPLSTQSLEGRFGFWQDSLAVLGAHPFGVGVNGFLNANAAESVAGSTLDSPHNLVLQVALAGGIPLLVVVLGIAAAVVACGVRAWRAAARGGVGHARADVLAAALAGLAGYGVALLTHFTAPSTTIVAAVLAGTLLAQVPDGGLRLRLGVTRSLWSGARTVTLAAWVLWLVVALSAEVPLATGVAAAAQGNLPAAEAAFERAGALRPWDADLRGIAAQSFAAAAAAAADGGLEGAAPIAVSWAERSRQALPGTVSTERALAVGQLNSGDTSAAGQTLEALVELTPKDSAVAVQNAVVRYLLGDISGAVAETDRALSLDPANPTAVQLRGLLTSP